MREGSSGFVVADKNLRLLRALAAELRTPLIQIARRSELASVSKQQNQASQLRDIETTADAALRLVDSYLFSTQVLLGQQRLPLEPVSVGATLYDTAQYLRRIAKLYQCDIDINISRHAGLAMANRQGLQAALTSLAYSMINSGGEQHRIVLVASKTNQGITAGVTTTNKQMSRSSLKVARQLFGMARRPLKESQTNGAGIYVADCLFEAMNAPMKVTRRQGSAGLAAVLLPSRQLALL